MQHEFDLFVVGAGSGGVRASRVAAALGARVGIAEQHRVGGTCVIRGCVPKKLLVFASQFRGEFEDACAYGWALDGARFSWPELIAAKDAEVARLERIYAGLLQESGVELFRGRAVLVDPHTLQVEGRPVSAANVLIATGGWPHMPQFAGVEHCISSNEVFELRELPRRVLVVGGGYIAAEFAGIFHGLGSEVTVSYRGDRLLRGFDEDVREHLGSELERRGVRLLLRSRLNAVMRAPDGGLLAALDVDGLDGRLACDAVLLATGRWPCTRGLGLEQAGVAMSAIGAVAVDEFSRTSVPHVYAVGDVTDRIALTPVAIREGQAVAQTLFGTGPVPVDHCLVPSAVFSQPQVGAVGLTEAQALERCGEVAVYKTAFRPLKHSLTGRQERTLMKLLVDPASDRVLGAHMVGDDAAEIIQGVAIAVRAGLTKRDFDATVGIHPTAAEEFVTLKDRRIVRRVAASSAAA